jgi:hypothetical protein
MFQYLSELALESFADSLAAALLRRLRQLLAAHSLHFIAAFPPSPVLAWHTPLLHVILANIQLLYSLIWALCKTNMRRNKRVFGGSTLSLNIIVALRKGGGGACC